jgi:glycosyltransferase involved in cell wall biosynthesis
MSALSQSYPSIEILLVDDGCTDGTMDVVKQIVCNHQREDDVHIITHQTNLGVSASRNQIIDEAPLGFFISQIHMVFNRIGNVLLVVEKNDTVSFCFDKLLISVEMTPEPVKHILPLGIEHMSST